MTSTHTQGMPVLPPSPYIQNRPDLPPSQFSPFHQDRSSFQTHYRQDRQPLQPLTTNDNTPIRRPVPVYETSAYMGGAFRTLYENYDIPGYMTKDDNNTTYDSSESSLYDSYNTPSGHAVSQTPNSSCHSCCHIVRKLEKRIEELEASMQSLKLKKVSYMYNT